MRVKKLLLWLLIGLAAAFVLAQARRPRRDNPPFRPEDAIEARTQMPPAVASVLARSCKDCHSRQTRWPWYSNVAPVSWVVAHDVEEARGHLDLSDFGSYGNEEGALHLGEICKEIRGGAMPLPRYVRAHPEAALSAEEKETLCEWTRVESRRLLSEPGAAAPTASGSAPGSS
jgi:hypothetical protein